MLAYAAQTCIKWNHKEKRDESTITGEYFNIHLKYFIGQLKIIKILMILSEIVHQFYQSDNFRIIHQAAVENMHIFIAHETFTKTDQTLK